MCGRRQDTGYYEDLDGVRYEAVWWWVLPWWWMWEERGVPLSRSCFLPLVLSSFSCYVSLFFLSLSYASLFYVSLFWVFSFLCACFWCCVCSGVRVFVCLFLFFKGG